MTTALLHRGSRFGDLRLTGYVGSGGFSDVYEAFDKSGRRLAIKVLRLTGLDSQGQQQRIERERETLSRVDSRGVAKLLHSDLQCDTPWIASEFIDGPTLQEVVESDGPLGLDEGLSLVRRLAEILSELHEEGIAHRDLSPNNIIIGPDGPVIIDFGSARIDLEGSATGSLLLAGTSGYVPPEALRGEPVGKAGDIFSLAKIAEFILSEVPNYLEALTQSLDDYPQGRPTAEQIASELASFDLVVARSTRRNVTKLSRRFRARSLVAAAIIVIAPTSYLTSLFVGDSSEVSTSSLFNSFQGEVSESWSDGLFAINRLPSDWLIERIRPIDSSFGYDVSDLDAIQLRVGDVENMDTTEEYAYGQIKVSSISHYKSSQQPPTKDELIHQLFDFAIDIFEVGYLPDGCNMQRADTPITIFESTTLLAASAPKCDGLGGETILVGVMMDWEREVSAQWFVDTTIPGAEAIFPLGVDLRSASPIQEIAGETSWKTATNLRDPQARAIWLKSSEDFVSFEWGSTGYVLGPNEGLRIDGGNLSDAQLSFFFINPDNKDGRGRPVPGGRWWVRSDDEAVTVTNPFRVPTYLFIEAEAVGSSSIDVTMQLVRGTALLEDLRTSLGIDLVSEITFDSSDSSAKFTLPSYSPSSANSVVEAPFMFGPTDLTYQSELPGASFGFDDLTIVTRSDRTQTVSEIELLETHDPHFLLYYAPSIDLVREEETSSWVSFGRPTGCLHNVEWEVDRSRATLLVDAYLGCRIDDAEYTSVASTVPQANVFFRFALIDKSEDVSILGGSFAPNSAPDLDRFRAFLNNLTVNNEEIVRHFQSLQTP
jgi:serine/threonine protein kinase